MGDFLSEITDYLLNSLSNGMNPVDLSTTTSQPRRLLVNMKKKLLVLLFIVPLSVFSQTEKSNFELIDNVKTQKSGKKIKKLLVGNWKFEKLTDKNGKTIFTANPNKSIQRTDQIYRPNIKIKKNGEYEFLNCKKPDCNKGTWEYDNTDKILRLTFDKPQYNVEIDKLTPGLLEQLKESGTLIEFKENYIEIAELSKTELIIIEHLPHNEFEFKYNLRVYNKK